VKQIIKAASTVTKKRERSEDVGLMVSESAAELGCRVLAHSHGADCLGDGLVMAVNHVNVRGPALASKQPARSAGVLCCRGQPLLFTVVRWHAMWCALVPTV